MPARLSELASLVQGRVIGNSALEIHGSAPLDQVGPGQITFIDNPLRVREVAASGAAAILAPTGMNADVSCPVIEVPNVVEAFAEITLYFRPARRQHRRTINPGAIVSPFATIGDDADIHPLVTIGPDVIIGQRCTIYPGVHIMAGCQLGDDVTIYPGAVLYEDTYVGSRVTIHAHVVIGGPGFGYTKKDGYHRPTPRLGYVHIESDVEIGCGSTVDRGNFGATVIGTGTKIDNQVQVAHNCKIGRHNLLCAQVGIAGTTSTGDDVVMAGQVGVRDHVHIGSGAILGAMAGVINDVPERACMIGIPATPEREQKLKQAAFARLPEMRRELRLLSKTVAALEQRHCGDKRHSDDQRPDAAAA